MNKTIPDFTDLQKTFEGDLYTDKSSQIIYATDASSYREIPAAVARPRHEADIKTLIEFARKYRVPLIPRAAGTSLAGQVVGAGLVVDISKYMTQILELDIEKKQVRIQPGVIRDELNLYLKPHGLFFSPETSTSNRCTLGGMLGNNACGAHSLVYGSTRDHIVSVKALLSDGSRAEFKTITKSAFESKMQEQTLEGQIYRNIYEMLSDAENRKRIRNEFPHPEIRRRNTGYAIDILAESHIFSDSDHPFNFAELLAGSEGTLAFITEMTVSLDDLPPAHKALIPVHTHSLEDAFKANLIALKYKPVAIELMDDIILQLSKKNRLSARNAFFVKDNPAALLMVELAEHKRDDLLKKANDLETALKSAGYGYHFPILFGDDIDKAYNLRKAGLGLSQNMPGDAKPVAVIEDTAVRPDDLPEYMQDFSSVLKKHNLSCVYYAHIATGELHLRPVINLKTEEGKQLFRTIAKDVAVLVKKYRGSLSGEHGDGRLRGEFIPLIIGEENYALVKSLKQAWDPEGIFNPGKITDTPLMNESLRYAPAMQTREIDTIFDFSNDMGYLRSAEKCTGSGDCRKSTEMGGTMCPSFQASKDEYNSTRARANILREYITHSQAANPFADKEMIQVLDLCLSCKACKSECPANVDITKLKAEAMQHYYDAHGIPLRSRLIANFPKINRLAISIPAVSNFFMQQAFFSKIIKRLTGFAPERSLPQVHNFSFKAWAAHRLPAILPKSVKQKVLIFNDEFTNYNDVEIGTAAVRLLCKLGYEPVFPKHTVSGRTYLSKGLLRRAKLIAQKNIDLLHNEISESSPLIGIEPSAILTFRDEYPDFFAADSETGKKARKMAEHCFTFEEFIVREFDAGNISCESFTETPMHIKFHSHCYQKALSDSSFTKRALEIPKNYTAEEIPSGCCGMAGAFGFEKEHYELSQKVGELVLFPEIRKSDKDEIIVAAGTSCRHQIKDGTKRQALHPAQVLLQALNSQIRNS